MKQLSLDYLQLHCKKIHAFGLGFIQIKLSDTERVHIYCPEVSITSNEEEIHNHRYGFTSTILKGSLTNIIYDLDFSKNTHFLGEESCDPNNPIENSIKIECGIKETVRFTSTKGSVYSIDKSTLHRVETKRAITHLIREVPSKKSAKVVSLKDKSLTCPFSVNLEEEKLWSLVEQELNSLY